MCEDGASIEWAVGIFGMTDGIPGYIKEVCYMPGHSEKPDMSVPVFQPFLKAWIFTEM